MANTMLTDLEAGNRVARTALSVLSRQLVLPATVYRDAESDFTGQTGDTITIRKPAVLTARTYSSRASAIVIDDVTESGVDVKFGDPIYSAVEIPDESMEFEVDDFTAQIVAPQLRAVGEGAENVLAAVFNSFTTADDLEMALDGSDALDTLIDAAAILNGNNVPRAGRYLAVSPEVEALLLKDDSVRKVNEAGSESALRQAEVGRLFGFQIFGSNALTGGSAVAYTREAFAFVMRSQRVPQGAKMGANLSYGGLALRWVMDYQSDYLQDRSIVTALCGAAEMDESRAVKITIAGS